MAKRKSNRLPYEGDDRPRTFSAGKKIPPPVLHNIAAGVFFLGVLFGTFYLCDSIGFPDWTWVPLASIATFATWVRWNHEEGKDYF
jgi:hypothetical protein